MKNKNLILTLVSIIVIFFFIRDSILTNREKYKYTKEYNFEYAITDNVQSMFTIVENLNKNHNLYLSDKTPIIDLNYDTYFIYGFTTYCSNSMYKDFILVLKSNPKVSYEELYIGDMMSREKVSTEEFQKYLYEYSIKCVNIDSYTGKNEETIYMLNPYTDYKNLYFYKSPNN